MKKIAFVFRSKERNEPSIETNFGNFAKYIEEKFETEAFFLPRGRYNKLSCLIENYRVAKKIKCDLYHITGEVYFVAPAFPKNRTIMTIQDYADLKVGGRIKRLIRYIFWHYIPMHHCRFAVCISKQVYDETKNMFPSLNDIIKYIPDSTNDKYQYTKHSFNMENPKVLAIGTRENKNLERTIKALQGIDCEFHIIGVLSEEQNKLLRQCKIKYVNKHHISEDEMLKEYINADIVSFASTFEGFGRPIIEANAIGRPVITSNIQPMIEVSGGASLLVNPYSIEDIHNAFLRLINDEKLREQLIKLGLKNAEQYSASFVGYEYTRLYDEIARR